MDGLSASDFSDAARKKPFFPVLFISDLHLIKKAACAELLLEFLSSVECGELHIVGDAIDGWKIESKDHQFWPEMHARILDVINEKASRHPVYYYAGNHDENLRKPWADKKHAVGGQNYDFPILGRVHEFTDKKKGIQSRIEIRESGVYTDPLGKRFLVLHGDQFDPRYLKTESGRILSEIGDLFYDGLVGLNAYSIKVGKKFFDTHFSLAKYLKKHTKKAVGVIESFEKTVANAVRDQGLDGVITGHIHHAEIRDFNGIQYMNAGDWVESATALTHDEHGNWRVVHWQHLRKDYGLKKQPSESDPNPYGDFRGITHRQLRAVQRLWPAKDRKKCLKTLFKLYAKQADPKLSPKKARAVKEQIQSLIAHLQPL